MCERRVVVRRSPPIPRGPHPSRHWQAGLDAAESESEPHCSLKPARELCNAGGRGGGPPLEVGRGPANRRAGRRVSCDGPRASLILAWSGSSGQTVVAHAAVEVAQGRPGCRACRQQSGRGPGSGRLLGQVAGSLLGRRRLSWPGQVPERALRLLYRLEVQGHGATRQLTLPPKSPWPG